MFFSIQKSTKISAVKEDTVQVITGKVVVPETVKIPGTEIRCACYWMMIEAWAHGARGRGRKMWVPSDTKQGCAGFYVEDDTGRLWIPKTADVIDIQSGWEDGGPIGKKGTQRFVSRSIKPGDIIKVRGTVSAPKGAEPGSNSVLRPDKKGAVRILLKKKAKNN